MRMFNTNSPGWCVAGHADQVGAQQGSQEGAMPANSLDAPSPSLSKRRRQCGLGAEAAPGTPPGDPSLKARPVGRKRRTVGRDATHVAGPHQPDWQQQGAVEGASGSGGSVQGAAVGEEHAFQDGGHQGLGEGQGMAAEGCSGQQCSRAKEPNGMPNMAVDIFNSLSLLLCKVPSLPPPVPVSAMSHA